MNTTIQLHKRDDRHTYPVADKTPSKGAQLTLLERKSMLRAQHDHYHQQVRDGFKLTNLPQ